MRQLLKLNPLVVSLISAISFTPLLFGSSPVLAQQMMSPTSSPSMMGPSSGGGMLSMGSQGEMVSHVQTMLKQQGFYNGPINGVFDQATQSAVMAFQRSHNLKADGVVGPRTMHTITVMSRSRS